ncbi:hypothetical protein HDU82_001271 [Entophlyctis luteolus]|nr:hypothetical protein HDU82_001271 [Entophlyctis luteolus]
MIWALLVALIPCIASAYTQPVPVPDSVTADLKEYTQLALAAYASENAITSWTCSVCNGSVSDVQSVVYALSADGQEQGFVAAWPSRQVVVLSIRGSRSLGSFIEDAQVVETAISNLTSVPAAVKLEPALVSAMDANPDFSVAFVGHSLGAASSLLAAVDLSLNGVVAPDYVSIVNMGSPRVGNVAFVNFTQSLKFARLSRVVNNNDIVPHLPPESEAYRHLSTEYWIEASGTVVTCDDGQNNGEDTDCANSVPADQYSVAAHTSYFNFTDPSGTDPTSSATSSTLVAATSTAKSTAGSGTSSGAAMTATATVATSSISRISSISMGYRISSFTGLVLAATVGFFSA